MNIHDVNVAFFIGWESIRKKVSKKEHKNKAWYQGCAILKFLILFGLQYSGDDFATPIPIMILDKVE